MVEIQTSQCFCFYDRDRLCIEDEIMGRCYGWLVQEQFDSAFYRCSSNSAWGQFDICTAAYTDSSGGLNLSAEIQTVLNLEMVKCCKIQQETLFITGMDKELLGDVQRHNLFVFVNHDLGNGSEAFAELGSYRSEYNGNRHSSAPFSSVKHVVPATNPYNFTGKALLMDNYRFVDAGPRIVDNDKETTRMLLGLRGVTEGGWDWESAVSYSTAEAEDVTHNRVSNTLIDQLLQATGPNAYNPFNGGGVYITSNSFTQSYGLDSWGNWTCSC